MAPDAHKLVRLARQLVARGAAARAAGSGRAPRAVWRDLLRGALVVVGHFAASGRRFLVLKPPTSGGASGGLTRRELVVCFLVARGRSNTAIGADLDVAPSTVATYVASAMAKVGVTTRVELVRLFAAPRAKGRRAAAQGA
jgi:DNA-binding NarL/FixJ family response regulator